MEGTNAHQLDSRIDAFLERKHQEFPELSLRHQRVERKKPSMINALLFTTTTHRWDLARR